MPLLIKSKTRFARKSKTGVTRIIRDGYSNDKGGWYTHVNAIKAVSNGCSGCGATKKTHPHRKFHTHHIKRLSRGGTTRKINLIELCDVCHDRRHPGHHLKERK